MAETVLANARVVLAGEVVTGSVLIVDGWIAGIDAGSAPGDDLAGDYLLPGLVELHTDHLESHYAPRPGVRWNALAAVQAHDAQIAASGITTVFDTLRIGSDERNKVDAADIGKMAEAIALGSDRRRLRAEHFIHLRCEVSAPDCETEFLAMADNRRVRLVSLMDHSPGQRQFATIELFRAYHIGKMGMTEAAFDAFAAQRMSHSQTFADRHREAIAARSHELGLVVASHDDASEEHVDQSIALGVGIAEFPTTLPAARRSHEAGLAVLMGAPNIVRGGSHSGNASAQEMLAAGWLDIVSSDYIPFSLMQAPFRLAEPDIGLPLHEAVALVSAHPARTLGLADRGEIAIGRRADLVQVSYADGLPLVHRVWREGTRVI